MIIEDPDQQKRIIGSIQDTSHMGLNWTTDMAVLLTWAQDLCKYTSMTYNLYCTNQQVCYDIDIYLIYVNYRWKHAKWMSNEQQEVCGSPPSNSLSPKLWCQVAGWDGPNRSNAWTPQRKQCIITLTDYLAKAAPRTDKTPMGVAKFVTFQHARGNIPAGERCVCILFMLAAWSRQW